jgi:osmotically-inducible protein OsmY
LTDDEHIDASEIEVSVSNGEVTLTGTLRSRNAKRRTTDVVEQVSGVKDVHNLIRVSDEQVRQVVREV